jgi:hypothetical protein
MAQAEYAVERITDGSGEYVAFFPTEREAVEHAGHLRSQQPGVTFKVKRLDRREVERYEGVEHRGGKQGA